MMVLKRLPALLLAFNILNAEPLPGKPAGFIERFCLDCHDSEMEKGGVNLEAMDVDWDQSEVHAFWERVLEAIQSGQMPPKDKFKPQPDERRAMQSWLDAKLTRHAKRGGTGLRRLNRDEYLQTVRHLFDLKIELPDGFPEDGDSAAFDTMGETLVLSPPLMQAYAETASMIADEIFPPSRPEPESIIRNVSPDEMVISYSSGSVRDGAMRLASQCSSMMRSCTWPSKVEIRDSGLYRISLSASRFDPGGVHPVMKLDILAKEISDRDAVSVDTLRKLYSVDLTKEAPERIEFDAELFEGETLVFYYANALLDSDREDKAQLQAYFRSRFEADPPYLAAWVAMTSDDQRGGFRGGLGWERVKQFLASKEDLDPVEIHSASAEKLLKRIAGNPVLFVETMAYDHFENGPALEIHHASVRGPVSLVDGPRERKRKEIQKQLLGGMDQENREAWKVQRLKWFLERAFRRTVEPETIHDFKQLWDSHEGKGHSVEQCFHLVLRAALLSPRFLYRELNSDHLDAFELAGRLSYFLTGGPPDAELMTLAETGAITDDDMLRQQARRLLPHQWNAPMIQRFTGQWLDTRLLDEIMPDPRLGLKEGDQTHVRQEIEMFFAEMLRENRPMSDFITPDFTYTSARIAQEIYQLDKGTFDKKNKGMQRVTLSRGGRHGGVLGQAGVLMATANGVDTQPVLRGVWVLENILGNSPPPPPNNVPAITPDTTGAQSPRELLSRHASDASCAACHKKIDPIGFALENFDAVGRWRDAYRVWSTNAKGKPISKEGLLIDPSGQLPDGTPIANVLELKAWIRKNIDLFSRCLAEKLMSYATGRQLSYIDRKEISERVRQNAGHENGFKDLVLLLIESNVFRSK